MKPYLLFIALFLAANTSFAQFFRDYHAGSYYTTDGQRQVGYVSSDLDPPSLFSSLDNTLFFKPDTNAKREKLKASTLRSFIVQDTSGKLDSFIVVQRLNRHRIKYDYDFIEVIYDRGPVKLYNYRLKRQVGGIGFGGVIGGAITGAISVGVDYYDNYYFYGEDIGRAVEMKKKDFKDVMSKMLSDDPEIVAMIQNEKYTMGDMHKMLKIYYATHPLAAR